MQQYQLLYIFSDNLSLLQPSHRDLSVKKNFKASSSKLVYRICVCGWQTVLKNNLGKNVRVRFTSWVNSVFFVIPATWEKNVLNLAPLRLYTLENSKTVTSSYYKACWCSRFEATGAQRKASVHTGYINIILIIISHSLRTTESKYKSRSRHWFAWLWFISNGSFVPVNRTN